MTQSRKLVLVVAIILGLGTMMMMRSALGHKDARPVAMNGIQVLVASSDVPVGHFLQANQVRWQNWAAEHVTEAFIRKAAPAGKAGQSMAASDMDDEIMGAVVRQPIKAGEPIMKGALVKPHDRGFLAAVLEPGRRAVAVPITNVTGIAGFVFPGDHVDLILTHAIQLGSDDNVRQRRASVTIVKDVRVLALDQETDKAAPAAAPAGNAKKEAKLAKVVTVEVSPKQAEIVTLSLQIGTLSLSLRSLATEDGEQIASTDGKPLAQPIAFEQSAYTMDSEVSHIIPRYASRDDRVDQVVQVLRGNSARKEESFSSNKDEGGE